MQAPSLSSAGSTSAHFAGLREPVPPSAVFYVRRSRPAIVAVSPIKVS
jgi:hypothetical protein